MQGNADTEAPNQELKGYLLAALLVCEEQAKAFVQQGISESDDAVYLRDQVVTAIERLLEHLQHNDGAECSARHWTEDEFGNETRIDCGNGCEY